ncbi:MAG: hypothetical protein ACRDXB_20755, partial [Actinomycetes bacterium]
MDGSTASLGPSLVPSADENFADRGDLRIGQGRQRPHCGKDRSSVIFGQLPVLRAVAHRNPGTRFAGDSAPSTGRALRRGELANPPFCSHLVVSLTGMSPEILSARFWTASMPLLAV